MSEASIQAVPPVRQCGSAVALVAGIYAVAVATTGTTLTANGVVLIVLGMVLLAHGMTIITPLAARIDAVSGPLMLLWATLLLLDQAYVGLAGGAAAGGATPTAGAAWDMGLAALAVLVFVHGLIEMVADTE